MQSANMGSIRPAASTCVQSEVSTAMAQFLPADYSTDFGYHSLNRAVDVQVRTRQNARVFLSLASGGQAQAATCTAHGTLDTLQ